MPFTQAGFGGGDPIMKLGEDRESDPVGEGVVAGSSRAHKGLCAAEQRPEPFGDIDLDLIVAPFANLPH
ncbi:MAG TPA: hypothetical protein VGR70_15470 [Stellaceae bacterium]|nr:hypothetical protein [Stellaceae bacterium]